MYGETAEEFSISLDQAVDDQLSQQPGAGWLKRDVFVNIVSSFLIDDGSLEDMTPCYYRGSMGRSWAEVSGYAISDGGRVLDLVAGSYGLFSGQTVPRDHAEKKIKWAVNFLSWCLDGLHETLKAETEYFDMAQTIRTRWSQFERVRIFFLVDGRLSIGAVPSEEIDGKPVVTHLWDIERLRRLAMSGRIEEPIVVDLKEFGGPIQCLRVPTEGHDYQCVFAVLPGRLLADMYERFGAKLLQRNVRSFLQIRGKINKGINETICSEPGRFLAYNNGISATATGIALDERSNGTYLVRLEDLQIVNGGQTTASLHHASVRDRADLSEILVPAKFTIVTPEKLNQLVPKISRYANSQNTISEADFESNAPSMST